MIKIYNNTFKRLLNDSLFAMVDAVVDYATLKTTKTPI